MADIYVTKKDDVYNVVDAEPSIMQEISETFSFEVVGREFMPAYKSKRWDGIMRLFSLKTGKLYAGLLPYLLMFAQNEGYSVDIDDSIDIPTDKPDEKDVISFMEKKLNIHAGGTKISPREAQVKSFAHAIASKRCVLEAATASGKSLTIYALLRYYSEIIPDDKKLLVIVPSITLVNQMFTDFQDYSSEDPDWNAEDFCHLVYEGQEKIDKSKKIIISTYQSIYKLDRKYFSNYDVVIGDEAHKFKAKTLKGIMEKMKNARYRIALTGTLHDAECHKWVIEGLFGLAKDIIKAKQMIDAGQAPPLKIECLVIKHPEKESREVAEMTYQQETKHIISLESRNKFIVDLTDTLKGNTLILTEFVENHAIPIYELLQKHTNKKVYLVHGKTEATDREYVRTIMEQEDNAIIVASYGVFSTGVSIKKLHNMIFASSPGKQKQRVVQSIGRQLRQHESKKEAKLYDITDDFTYKKKKNFTLKHFIERMKIYINEEHPYRIIPVKL